jgi:hypothetical protein
LKDTPILLPACPACGGFQVLVVFREDAWVKRSATDFQRVPVEKGAVRLVDCACRVCPCRWTEKVTND